SSLRLAAVDLSLLVFPRLFVCLVLIPQRQEHYGIVFNWWRESVAMLSGLIDLTRILTQLFGSWWMVFLSQMDILPGSPLSEDVRSDLSKLRARRNHQAALLKLRASRSRKAALSRLGGKTWAMKHASPQLPTLFPQLPVLPISLLPSTFPESTEKVVVQADLIDDTITFRFLFSDGRCWTFLES